LTESEFKMNANMRRSRHSIETVLRVKAMLAIMGPKEASENSPMSMSNTSAINTGRTWADVDASKAAAARCIGCGRILVDPLDECIYIVATDEYACNQACIDRSQRPRNTR